MYSLDPSNIPVPQAPAARPMNTGDGSAANFFNNVATGAQAFGSAVGNMPVPHAPTSNGSMINNAFGNPSGLNNITNTLGFNNAPAPAAQPGTPSVSSTSAYSPNVKASMAYAAPATPLVLAPNTAPVANNFPTSNNPVAPSLYGGTAALPTQYSYDPATGKSTPTGVVFGATKQTAPVTTPTTPTTPTPNTGEQTMGGSGLTNGTPKANIDTTLPDYVDPNKPVNEDQVRANTLGMFQQQIDAVKQLYGAQIAQARVNGLNQIGDAGVSAARGGMLGGTSAADAYGTVNHNTLNTTTEIAGQEGNAIGDIIAKAQGLAETTIARQQQAKQVGGQQYHDSIIGKETIRKQNISDVANQFAMSGVDPSTLTAKDLSDMASPLNSSSMEMMAAIKGAQLSIRQSIATTNAKNNTVVGPGATLITPDGHVIGTGGNTPQVNDLLSKVAQFAPSSVLAPYSKGGVSIGQLVNDPNIKPYLGLYTGVDPVTNAQTVFSSLLGGAQVDTTGGLGNPSNGTNTGFGNTSQSMSENYYPSAAATNPNFSQSPTFQTLKPAIKALVAGFLNYQNDPNAAENRTGFNLVKGAIDQIDPNFDSTKYMRIKDIKADYSAPSGAGGNITAANTVALHLDKLGTDFQALNNSGFQPWNYLANNASYLSTEGHAAANKVQQDITAIQEELKGVYAGASGGSESEFKAFGKDVSVNMTPSAMQSFINSSLNLVYDKTDVLNNKYQQQTGESFPIWDAGTAKVLQKYGVNPSPGTIKGQPASSTNTATSATTNNTNPYSGWPK